MAALRTEKQIEIARPSRGLDAETSAPDVGSGRSVFLDIPFYRTFREEDFSGPIRNAEVDSSQKHW